MGGGRQGARLDLVPRRVAGRHVTSPAFGSYRCVSWVDLSVALHLVNEVTAGTVHQGQLEDMGW